MNQMQQPLSLYATCYDPADSYGRIAVELFNAWRGSGIHVNALGGAPQPPNTPPIIPTMGGVMMGYPVNFHKFGPLAMAGQRVAITMFESTELPAGWVVALNNCARVIVPSWWVSKMFSDNGVTAPISVLPLGIGEAFTYRPRTRRKRFTFLAIADRGNRKGGFRAVWALNRAFGVNNMRVRLILKARDGAFDPNFVKGNKNVKVVMGDLSESELAALYAEADCMVFPSAGEGFGLPPREFAATGGLVLATNWSGTADHLPEWGIPIPYTMGTAWISREEPAGAHGQWAVPDVDYTALLMQMAAGIPLRARNAWGKAASERVRQRYQWSAFARDVYQTWKEVMSSGNRNAA